MSIDPNQPATARKRFFTNEATTLLRLEDGAPQAYLMESTSRIIRDCPPSLPWAASSHKKSIYHGLFDGPTSIAYLFLTISAKHPDLEISGKKPEEWCRAYLELGQDTVDPLLDASCGITNEYLASNALKACLYRSERHATNVLEAVRQINAEPSYCEYLNGRAGTLYILRILRKWAPGVIPELNPEVFNLTKEINKQIKSLIEDILTQDPWVWSGKQYLGAVHGEIGILTQIILSDPSYAPRLERKLFYLLKLQNEEGNLPVQKGKERGIVEFCHGAPGFVLSLLAIRPHFIAWIDDSLTLRTKIDDAITLGRKLIWERGLLTKEPVICHGITGNALALEKEQREHFLCHATPEKIENGLMDGFFEESSKPFSLLWGEAGRAWVWMEVWDGGEGECVLYTDV